MNPRKLRARRELGLSYSRAPYTIHLYVTLEYIVFKLLTQTLKTTLEKVSKLENTSNRKMLQDFDNYMVKSDKSDRTRRNNLKYMLNYVEWLAKFNNKTINDVKEEQDILDFLKTKIKLQDHDPDRRWITTYNDYLIRLKHFFRWLKNHKKIGVEDDWITPKFIKIKKKKTKRESPYLKEQLWEKHELQAIIKHEPDIRNKAIIALLWDFDARNHEVTTLDIRNIVFKEKYAQGELSPNTKAGSRTILLRLSFPYVRDWLNNYHPDKTNPKAKLICSHKPTVKLIGKEKVKTYGKLDPDSLWWIMIELKRKIRKKLDEGLITDEKEIELLERLLKTKSWNPYCIRHSAITDDNANLKGDIAAKVGWKPNTKQRNRYVKSKMGNDMIRNVLERDGIILDENENVVVPSSKICYRCNYMNGFDYQVCHSCGYPLSQEALSRIKEEEDRKFNDMNNKYALMSFQREIDNVISNSKALANARDGDRKRVEWSKEEQLRYFMNKMKREITKEQFNYIQEYLMKCEPVELFRSVPNKVQREEMFRQEKEYYNNLSQEELKELNEHEKEVSEEESAMNKGKSEEEIREDDRRSLEIYDRVDRELGILDIIGKVRKENIKDEEEKKNKQNKKN